MFGRKSPATIELEKEIATLQQRLAQRRDASTHESVNQDLPSNTHAKQGIESKEPKYDGTTKRRQTLCEAAERYSARCDRKEQEVATPGVLEVISWYFDPIQKKAKEKIPTRRQPSRTKILPQVEALSVGNVRPKSTTILLLIQERLTHVLLLHVRQQHMNLLTNVQLSGFGQPPYAILRAANGQIFNAIGRSMLTIQTITIVAFIFRDGDLVHILLVWEF